MSEQLGLLEPAPQVDPTPRGMTPAAVVGPVAIFLGNNMDVLRRMPEKCCDGGVTDPPYGIGFMGEEWDTFKPEALENKAAKTFQVGRGVKDSENPNLRGRSRSPAISPSQIEYDRTLAGQRAFQAWCEEWAREVYRVLKPGAYLVVCGAPRSAHRMIAGLEDAGFVIDDAVAWLCGSGFPKSFNFGCICRDRDAVPDVRDGVHGPSKDNQESGGASVLKAMQRPEAVAEDAASRRVQDAEGHASSSSRAQGRSELRMEGRCDVQAEQGELHRAKVRAVPGTVSGDGKGGRVCDGASACDGDASRPLLDQDRGSASSRPQHQEQPDRQPRVVSGQRHTQASRGRTTTVCPECGRDVRFKGYGTKLKPGFEPIAVAQRPFDVTVQQNMETWGVGAINVDAGRLPVTDAGYVRNASGDRGHANNRTRSHAAFKMTAGQASDIGRWPPNVAMDEASAAALDAQAGTRTSGANPTRRQSDKFRNVFGTFKGEAQCTPARGADSGGASRFFYVAKPSRAERDFGCEQLAPVSAGEATKRKEGSRGLTPYAGAGRTAVLNTGEIDYYDAAWVNAVLSHLLPEDMAPSATRDIDVSATRSKNGCVWSMCWCGSVTTDPFHPAIRSIIATATSSTTESKISNVSRRPHTNGCMAAAFSVATSGGNLAAYAEMQSPWMRRTGTSRKRAGPSMDDADLATSVASWLTKEPETGGGHRVSEVHNAHPT